KNFNETVKTTTKTLLTTPKQKILPTKTTEFYTIQQPPTTRLFNNYEKTKKNLKQKIFGIKQRIVCPPLDILFIVDSSGSVHKVYEEQKEWLQNLLENIELNDDIEDNNKINISGHRVALIQFASADLQKIEWEWDHFRKNWQMMENFNKNVRHITGTTYIGQALKQALKLLEERRRQVPIIVILLSDGFSQDDAIKQAEAIRHLPNLQFYALSIGQLSNVELLHRIVDNPSHVFIGNESSELLRSQLLRRIRCN
uniref:VWFA domain-containing protein n=1 Tax=Meloidogyne hapla TaxID=6305 RepID=A0A1I8B310_MELHA